MHIIGILIGIIGFVAVWYWRLKMLGDVAKDGRKVAETIVNLPRRMMFKHRSGKGGLDVGGCNGARAVDGKPTSRNPW